MPVGPTWEAGVTSPWKAHLAHHVSETCCLSLEVDRPGALSDRSATRECIAPGARGSVGRNPVPLKEATSWMVCKGRSLIPCRAPPILVPFTSLAYAQQRTAPDVCLCQPALVLAILMPISVHDSTRLGWTVVVSPHRPCASACIRRFLLVVYGGMTACWKERRTNVYNSCVFFCGMGIFVLVMCGELLRLAQMFRGLVLRLPVVFCQQGT